MPVSGGSTQAGRTSSILLRVASRVAAHPAGNERMVAAAFLHDVVEDTDYGLPTVEQEFGPEVARRMRLPAPPAARRETMVTTTEKGPRGSPNRT